MNDQLNTETSAASDLPLHKLPRIQPGEGFTLLSGVKVLDLTTSVAGPYATMLLSDFGAEVIKIEKPGGDDARMWGPPFLGKESLWFSAVNRNKQSVVLDITEPSGRVTVLNLARTADVVITNMPPRVQKKLKLDRAAFSKVRSDIVFVSITGFGLSGRRADFTCYDLIAEGYSGIMDITGEAYGPPQKIGAPAADMLAGQDAAMATLAALFDRQNSGKGRLIDVSLVESMTRFLTCRISAYLGSGEIPTRSGGTDSVIAIYQRFETADLPITLGLGNDGIWQRFWEAVGRPDIAGIERYSSNVLRRQHRNEIVAYIQEILLTRGRDDWLQLLARARVPAGPINSVDEVVGDSALIERGLFYAIEDGNKLVPQIGLGIHIDGRPAVARSAPPLLGEHTDKLIESSAQDQLRADNTTPRRGSNEL